MPNGIRQASSNIANRIASRLTSAVTGLAAGLAAGSFPRTIRVECTNACNARCVICPHQTMTRPVAVMPAELYGRIVAECGRHRCKEIHLHNFGEPLLDPELENRIRMAKAAGIGKVKIFTNGSLLTPERGRQLLAAGLDEIVVSFDGADAEEFERIRVPLKFDVVTGNLRSLVQIRNETRSFCRIKVACCSTQNKSRTAGLLPPEGVDKFSFGKIHNWATEGAGEPEGSRKSKIRKSCSRVWRTFTILASGEVALCCLDYDGRVILGNLKTGATIQEIYRSAAYARLRRLHRTGRQHEIEICRNCSKTFV